MFSSLFLTPRNMTIIFFIAVLGTIYFDLMKFIYFKIPLPMFYTADVNFTLLIKL